PVDILTFHYNKNMAYAPAAKTYDEAIDNVVELWPELREVERDRIHLLVTGSDHLVRVPRMTWTAVLCDLPRYEVVHVQVEELPPPPQYQGKGKENGETMMGKGAGRAACSRRSGGSSSAELGACRGKMRTFTRLVYETFWICCLIHETLSRRM
ncbi:hypothetical protein EDB85DRAFT_1860625, partial [Lactarius pseudohatsudake]